MTEKKNHLLEQIKTLDLLRLSAYLYLYIPIVIFFLTWEKIWIAILCTCLIIYIICSGLRHTEKSTVIQKEHILPALVRACIPILVFSLWCILSGIGGYVEQAGDWQKHNLILELLVDRNWPVQIEISEGEGILTYYLGAYLIPALAGKAWGFHSAEIVMLILSVVGLFIAFYIISRELELEYKNAKWKILWITMFCLIFFAMFTIPLHSVYGVWYPEDVGVGDWMAYSILVQFTSVMMMLRWVTPQFIFPLITVALLYADRKNYRRWGGYIIPLLFYSIFAFLGVCILVLFVCILNLAWKNKNWRASIHELFSRGNIASVIVLLPLLLYIFGLMIQEKPAEAGMYFEFIDYSQNLLALVLIELSWGLWAIILFEHEKKNVWFWSSCAIMFILPFCQFGFFNDLCMRTSIPPILFFIIFLIRFTLDKLCKKDFRTGILIFLCLFFVSSASVKDIYDAAKNGLQAGNGRYDEIDENMFSENPVYRYQYVNWDKDGIVKFILKDSVSPD